MNDTAWLSYVSYNTTHNSILRLLPSALVWGFDLFSQCMCVGMYVRTCLSCSRRSICTHCLHSHAYVHAQKLMSHVHWRWQGRTVLLGNGGHRGQLVLSNVRVLRSWVLDTADGWWHWEGKAIKSMDKRSQEARREPVQKKKAHCIHKPGTCGASSQTRYTLSCLIQP